MSGDELARLLDLADAYRRLETSIENQLRNGDETYLPERVAVCMFYADQIREDLRELSTINVSDPQMRDSLTNVRDEKTLVDRLLAEGQPVLTRLMYEKGYLVDEKFVPEEFDKAQEELNSVIFPLDFIKRQKKVGALVLGQSVPEAVGRFFIEVKDCFVFGQLVACVALCRTLVETCFRDFLERRGALRRVDRKEFNDWGPKRLLREVRSDLRQRDREAILDAAGKIIETSSGYIHWKVRSGPVVSSEQCLSLLRATLAVVGYLYRI